MTRHNQLGFATRCVHAGQEPDPTTGAVMVPIYATSTYQQQARACTRATNTRAARTRRAWRWSAASPISKAGQRGFAFASGLAAIATVLELLDHGAHVVVGRRHLWRLLPAVRARAQAHGGPRDSPIVDLAELTRFPAAIRANTRMIWIETPTNPTLKLADLDAIVAAARTARHPHRGRQHLRQPMGAAAAGARLRHRGAFDDQIPQRPLRHGRRPGDRRRQQGAKPTGSAFCRTPSARSRARSTAFSRCAG